MIVDALVEQTTHGRAEFDQDARIALSGRTIPELLIRLMHEPYLRKKPPKSAGREQFGQDYAQNLLTWGKQHHAGPADLVRTTTVFTSLSIADAFRRFILPRTHVEELIVAGGGARNPLMMAQLAASLPGIEVVPASRFGVPPEAKEAFGFALLAYETYHGRPSNLPSATGAKHAVVLGKIAHAGKLPASGESLIFGAAHVSHLRRLERRRLGFPTLPGWANVCRAYGARNRELQPLKESPTAQVSPICKAASCKDLLPVTQTSKELDRWRRRALACAVLVVAFLSGCGRAREANDPNTVNFLIESMPINLDPRIGTDAQSQHLDGLIFDSLVSHDAKMNIVPDLATSWETPDPRDVRVSSAARREIPRRPRVHIGGREVHV